MTSRTVLRTSIQRTPLFVAASVALACADVPPTSPSSPGPRAVVASGAMTSKATGPAECVKDTKLIGRVAASSDDQIGTWWYLTRERFDALGVTDYKAAIEGFYGQSFATLDEAIDFLIAGVSSYDANGNGYVCAYEVRGTRAWLGQYVQYLFGIADDKHADD